VTVEEVQVPLVREQWATAAPRRAPASQQGGENAWIGLGGLGILVAILLRLFTGLSDVGHTPPQSWPPPGTNQKPPTIPDWKPTPMPSIPPQPTPNWQPKVPDWLPKVPDAKPSPSPERESLPFIIPEFPGQSDPVLPTPDWRPPSPAPPRPPSPTEPTAPSPAPGRH
jgi:hypothetical protein